jgi:pilus assembly protein Flp/PilA
MKALALNARGVKNSVARFVRDDEAATAAEYGILAALVAVAIITAVKAFGGGLSTLFTGLGTTVAKTGN